MRFPSAAIITLLLVQAILTISVSDAGSGSKDQIDSDSSDLFSFTPIVINGNNDLMNQATAAGWNGSGTSDSPYIIENLVIQTDSENGVYVANTNMFLIFRNCSFISAVISGFKIWDSENIHFLNISTDHHRDLFDITGGKNIEMEMIDTRSFSVHRWAMINNCNDITLTNSSLNGYMRIYYSQGIMIDNVTGMGGSDAVNIRYSSRLTIKNSNFETMSPIDAQYTDDILIQNNVLNGSRTSEFNNCQGVKIVHNLNSSGSPYGFQFEYCSGVSIRDNDLQGSLGGIELMNTGNVKMYNNTLGSDGLLLSGSRFDLDSLIIPINNTVNGDPILFMKDGDLTPLQENPDHSQIIMHNMPGFSLADQEYDWNPCPLQVFYSSDISLNRVTISNASIGFAAEYSSGILIENCMIKDFRESAVKFEQCIGIRIDECDLRSEDPGDSISLSGCRDFEILATSMEIRYGKAITISSSQNGVIRELDLDIFSGIVELYSSFGISFESCMLEGSVSIDIDSSSEVRVRDSSISSDSYCLLMTFCNSIVVENNNLTTDHDHSIRDRYSSGNRYYSNKLTHGGIRFDVRSTVMIDMELPSNNTLNKRPIIHMTDEDKRTINESEEWGQIILNGVNSHSISGLDAQNRSYPLQLISCSNLRLIRCNFRNSTFAILSHFSFPITLTYCEFHNTDYCIVGYDSGPMLVENCIFNLSRSPILMERGYGDTPVYSIKIRDCTMMNCTYLVEIEDAEDVEISGCSFTGGTSGISIQYGIRASITGCTFFRISNYCIYFRRFNDNEVRGNLFMNCTMGVTMDRSYGNEIYENLFLGSESYGLRSEYTYNNPNWFFRNIFIENNGAGEVYNSSHPQAYSETNEDQWNNSHKRGNYWGDWTEPDVNENGIVDDPYPIPVAGNSDLYPLVELPFKLIGSPQKIKGSAGNGYIIVSWNPPIWNRLLEVEGYRILRSDSTGNLVEYEVGPGSLHFNDTNIVNGRRYTYEITASNLFDESHPSVPISLIGDGTPPIFSSISPDPGSVFNTTSVELEWDCYDTGVGIGKSHISLDGGDWKQSQRLDSHTFFNLSDGNHTARVRSFDMIGNHADGSIYFIVDTTPPEIIIRSDFEGQFTNRSNSTIQWSAVDELSGLDYYMISVNGAKWAYWGLKDEYTFEGLVTEQFNISVMAVDKAGNRINRTVQYFCDIDPPEAELISPAPGSNFEGRSVFFSWFAKDNGTGISSIRIYLDGYHLADVLDLESFWKDGISPGPHTASLIVEDISGNSAGVTVDFTTGVLPQIVTFSPIGSNVEMSSHIGFGLSKDISTIDFLIAGVAGTTVISGSNAVFEPDEALLPLTQYEVLVSGTDIHDLPFGPFNWSFKTVSYARVIGKVVDRGDRALVGVKIFVDGERVTPTDYTGSFELFLDRGHHTVDLQFEGYLNRSVEVDVFYGQSLDLGEIVLDKETRGSGPKDDGVSSFPGLVLVILVVLLTVTLIIVLILIRKRKEIAVSEPDEVEEDNAPFEGDPENTPHELGMHIPMENSDIEM